MNKNQLPEGWDENRVRRVLGHYDGQPEGEAAEEDEAGVQPSDTVMAVPHELVSRVRELIAKHRE